MATGVSNTEFFHFLCEQLEGSKNEVTMRRSTRHDTPQGERDYLESVIALKQSQIALITHAGSSSRNYSLDILRTELGELRVSLAFENATLRLRNLVKEVENCEQEARMLWTMNQQRTESMNAPQFVALAEGFFTDIPRAQIDGTFLKFIHEVPDSANMHQVVIRDSYVYMRDEIVGNAMVHPNRPWRFLVTGTPGIEKTLFLFYLLWDLVNSKRRVWFIYDPYNVYFDGERFWKFRGTRVPEVDFRDPQDPTKPFWRPDLYFLLDCKNSGGPDAFHGIKYDACQLVVSASPRRHLLNDFVKNRNTLQSFYMPIWSMDELRVMASVFNISEESWTPLFELLGGVPRHIFNHGIRAPIVRVEITEALKDMDYGKLRRITRWEDLPESSSEKWSRISHRVLHMHSVAPFKTYKIQFASEWVSRRAWELIVKGSADHWNDLMASEARGPFSLELGKRFEKYALRCLTKGGEFTCCRLNRNGRKTFRGEDFKLTIPPSNAIQAKGVLATHCVNQLYIPSDGNHAGIDAWMPGVGGFQITINVNHRIHKEIARDLPKLSAGGKHKLIWVVRKFEYHRIRAKSPKEFQYDELEQSALLMPTPSYEEFLNESEDDDPNQHSDDQGSEAESVEAEECPINDPSDYLETEVIRRNPPRKAKKVRADGNRFN